jgi:hypothetical protein
MYGDSVFEKGLGMVRELNDSSIICSGASTDSLGGAIGLVIKVNQNGDSIWERNYTKLFGGYSGNVIYDIQPEYDKGFITTGELFPFGLPDTGTQDAWVLKLDSLGCDTAGCDPTFGIHDIAPPPIGELEIYPNPFTNNIAVKFRNLLSPQSIMQKTTIKIIDVTGKEVFSKQQNFLFQNKILLNVSHLEKGIYFLQAEHGNKKYLRKIVKM